jgi:membrane protein
MRFGSAEKNPVGLLNRIVYTDTFAGFFGPLFSSRLFSSSLGFAMTVRQPIIQKALGRAQYLWRRYRDDRCHETVTALVYMTLFGLVPLITVLYGLASVLPNFNGSDLLIQDFLVDYLLPESSAAVADYLRQFSLQARNLSTLGVVILVVTAVLMLRSIEAVLNHIWRVKKARSGLSSLLVYWAVLSLTPILVGAAIGLSAYLYAASNFLNLELSQLHGLLPLLPHLITATTLSLLYLVVPSSDVPPLHALIGGLSGAFAFYLARRIFALGVIGADYTFVYGTFAAIPLFLVWLYVFWSIVLLGALLTHSLSAWQSEQDVRRPLLLKALLVLFQLWRAHQNGGGLRERAILRGTHAGWGLDAISWQTIRDRLEARAIISTSGRNQFLLSRDLNTVSLDDLAQLLSAEPDVSDFSAYPLTHAAGVPWLTEVLERLNGLSQVQTDHLSISLFDLFSPAALDKSEFHAG